MSALPSSLAFDGATLYWTTGFAIERMNIVGGTPEVVRSLARPRTLFADQLAVDALYVYWLEQCDTSALCTRILRAPKAGGDPTVLVEDQLIVRLVVDRGDTFYTVWRPMDGAGDALVQVSAAGVRKELVSGLQSPSSIAILGDDVLFFAPGPGVARVARDGTTGGRAFDIAILDPPGLMIDGDFGYFDTQGRADPQGQLWRVARSPAAPAYELVMTLPPGAVVWTVHGGSVYVPTSGVGCRGLAARPVFDDASVYWIETDAGGRSIRTAPLR